MTDSQQGKLQICAHAAQESCRSPHSLQMHTVSVQHVINNRYMQRSCDSYDLAGKVFSSHVFAEVRAHGQ